MSMQGLNNRLAGYIDKVALKTFLKNFPAKTLRTLLNPVYATVLLRKTFKPFGYDIIAGITKLFRLRFSKTLVLLKSRV